MVPIFYRADSIFIITTIWENINSAQFYLTRLYYRLEFSDQIRYPAAWRNLHSRKKYHLHVVPECDSREVKMHLGISVPETVAYPADRWARDTNYEEIFAVRFQRNFHVACNPHSISLVTAKVELDFVKFYLQLEAVGYSINPAVVPSHFSLFQIYRIKDML